MGINLPIKRGNKSPPGQKELQVKLPEKIANFYQIQKKEVMQVFLNNKTLLTMIGTVQE